MTDIIILIIILIVCAIAVAVGFYILWYINYSRIRYFCDGIVTFNKFLDIYEHSSNMIYLNEKYFAYSYYDEGNFHAATYNFSFSILDTFRYERWRKKLERMENEERSKKLMKQMEELWVEDARKSQKQTTH